MSYQTATRKSNRQYQRAWRERNREKSRQLSREGYRRNVEARKFSMLVYRLLMRIVRAHGDPPGC